MPVTYGGEIVSSGCTSCGQTIVEGNGIQGCTSGNCGNTNVIYEGSSTDTVPFEAPSSDGTEATEEASGETSQEEAPSSDKEA